MAAPPYSYGGYTGQPGRVPNQRDALLNALNQYDQASSYQYPAEGQIPTGKAPTGTGSQIADIAGGTLGNAALARPIIGALGGNVAKGALGGAAGMGLGIATELGGALLKPKVQGPTASPYGDLTDQYGRREEGSGEGIAGGAVKWGGRGAQIGSVVPGIGTAIGGAVGALGGAIGNAFTKNAASAYSDFSRADAIKSIQDMYQTRGGRMPTAQEVNQILVGAGTKAGDKWVGEKGLYSILSSLDQNFAQEKAQTAATALGFPGQQGAPQAPGAPQGGDPRASLLPNENRVAGPQAPSGVPQLPGAGGDPGIAAPADPGALAGPAQDQSKWNTDQYAKPAYIAQNPGKVMPGFDEKKWNDPNHQTPKYVVGRILSQIPVGTENMDQAVAEIAKAYPGARRTGSGDVTIPGVGVMDILVGADVGGKRWHAGSASKGDKGGGKSGAAGAAGAGGGNAINNAALASGASKDPAGYDSGGDVAGGNSVANIIKRLGALSGGGTGVLSNRDALIKQIMAG